MTERPPDRPFAEVRAELLELQRHAGTLATDVLDLKPTLMMVLRRKKLQDLEQRHAQHFTSFMNLDADLTAHARIGGDINSAIMAGIQFQIHFGIRDSVRGVLTDTGGLLNGLRSQLDFRGSLAISVVAIVISLISVAVGVGG